MQQYSVSYLDKDDEFHIYYYDDLENAISYGFVVSLWLNVTVVICKYGVNLYTIVDNVLKWNTK